MNFGKVQPKRENNEGPGGSLSLNRVRVASMTKAIPVLHFTLSIPTGWR